MFTITTRTLPFQGFGQLIKTVLVMRKLLQAFSLTRILLLHLLQVSLVQLLQSILYSGLSRAGDTFQRTRYVLCAPVRPRKINCPFTIGNIST